jgi:hypothetical protein
VTFDCLCGEGALDDLLCNAADEEREEALFINNNNLLYYRAQTMVKQFLSTLHRIKQEDKL